jgi:hypothetical protein
MLFCGLPILEAKHPWISVVHFCAVPAKFAGCTAGLRPRMKYGAEAGRAELLGILVRF